LWSSRIKLLRISPDGFRSTDDSNIPVVLQRLYPREESSVLLASGIEVVLIRAEASVRSGQTAAAAQLLNNLRSDYSLRVMPNLNEDMACPDGPSIGAWR
jgi:hypothetical protein